MLGLNIALIARLAYGVLWGHVYPWTGIHLYGVCRAVVALGSGEFSSLLSEVSKIPCAYRAVFNTQYSSGYGGNDVLFSPLMLMDLPFVHSSVKSISSTSPLIGPNQVGAVTLAVQICRRCIIVKM